MRSGGMCGMLANAINDSTFAAGNYAAQLIREGNMAPGLCIYKAAERYGLPTQTVARAVQERKKTNNRKEKKYNGY